MPDEIQETAWADPTPRKVESTEAFLQIAVPVDMTALSHFGTESARS